MHQVLKFVFFYSAYEYLGTFLRLSRHILSIFSTFLQKMMKSGLNRHLLKGYLYIQRILSLDDIKETVRSRINSQLL